MGNQKKPNSVHCLPNCISIFVGTEKVICLFQVFNASDGGGFCVTEQKSAIHTHTHTLAQALEQAHFHIIPPPPGTL